MFLIRFLFRWFFRVIFLAILCVIGFVIYLYISYKPLIDFIRHPENFVESSQNSISTTPILLAYLEDKSSVETASDAGNFRPILLAQDENYYKKKAQDRFQQELEQFRAVPKSQVLDYIRGKIQEARQLLDKASVKLAQANPQDPSKRAKVEQARKLLPKAYEMLNKAEALVNKLAAIQDQFLGWFKTANP